MNWHRTPRVEKIDSLPQDEQLADKLSRGLREKRKPTHQFMETPVSYSKHDEWMWMAQIPESTYSSTHWKTSGSKYEQIPTDNLPYSKTCVGCCTATKLTSLWHGVSPTITRLFNLPCLPCLTWLNVPMGAWVQWAFMFVKVISALICCIWQDWLDCE